MPRLAPTPKTVKKLFAVCGNQCAFPECDISIVDEKENILGEICHIEAAEANGQRYNSNQTDEQRRSLSNLVLLCANHHIVTNDVERYPVIRMREIKARHEADFSSRPLSSTDEIIDALLTRLSDSLGSLTIHTGSGNQITNYGLSYSETKDLFFELFQKNFPRIQQMAEETARRRVSAFVQRFFGLASERISEEHVATFSDPDFQFVLARAIESAARFDSEILRAALATLLLRRIEGGNEDLKKRVYDAAVSTASKLTLNQLKILTLYYLLDHQVFAIEPKSWQELEDYFRDKVHPFLDFRNVWADFRYIDFCGCCTVDSSSGPTSYAQIVKNSLRFLFPELGERLDEQSYIESVICDELSMGAQLIRLWKDTSLWAIDLTAVGRVIVEVFYEVFTGEVGFINLEPMFKEEKKLFGRKNA